MGLEDQGTQRANDAQVLALVGALQNRHLEATDSSDIASQAALLPIGGEDDFVGEAHVVRISRDAGGLRIVSTEVISTNE